MLDVKSQDISIPEAVVVLCTAPDEATAQDLAAKVLAEKLAACATLLPARHRCTTGKANWSRSMKFK
ncbi:Divalent cation tolerance protein [Salmonella enterica subsp. enterica]|nr:Divalent cation tolerance protein [Salmonella enterica subsp. enterica]